MTACLWNGTRPVRFRRCHQEMINHPSLWSGASELMTTIMNEVTGNMAVYSGVRLNMKERLAEFDPAGDLVRDAAEIFSLFDDGGAAVAAAFTDCYFLRTNLARLLPPAAVASIKAAGLEFVKNKFSDIGGNFWAESADGCLFHARKHGISVHAVLASISATNERALDVIIKKKIGRAHV